MNYEKIVQVINDGGLVVLPTDTIYGIIGDALNKKAIEKVYIAKKRDKNKEAAEKVVIIKLIFSFYILFISFFIHFSKK